MNRRFVLNYNEPQKIRQLTTGGYSHEISMNKVCQKIYWNYKTLLKNKYVGKKEM